MRWSKVIWFVPLLAWCVWVSLGTSPVRAQDLPWVNNVGTEAEYRQLRERATDDLEDQLRLADFARGQSWQDRERAHLTQALAENPGDRMIRSRLGHVDINGTWYTREQIEDAESNAYLARQRFEDWKWEIAQIAELVSHRSRKKSDEGWSRLRSIDDPRSITAIEVLLGFLKPPVAKKAIDVIHQYPHREATESLTRIGLFSRYDDVRDLAAERLSHRNRYDYIPQLMADFVSPISTRYVIRPSGNGGVLYQYVLFQQNMESDHIRQFDLTLSPTNRFVLPREQQAMLMNVQSRAQMAENFIRQMNVQIERKNAVIGELLCESTGADPGSKPADWWDWWYDENEIVSSSRPVVYSRYQSDERVVTSTPVRPRFGECLVAGSLVWRDDGPIEIEKIETGDRVLSFNLDTKRVETTVVLRPTTRELTETFKIHLDDGSIIQASGGHLFYVIDQGWTKARALTAGCRLACQDGGMGVQSVKAAAALPLYNLIVEKNANYFVGESRILSHDSTILKSGERSVESRE